ncbi:OLC1v1000386C1 [Oldenlandia corymbosa var. corymbosa]|uniref:OLC1v1000386C1 n=1 Tax=Oldenlandia corymbosa var. corymbosa TaxID=529605 RepID=A0AAV1D2Q3_OLDCO|nr:OLC1v1000386C1 [Oldenlandia corymbosa var. corymbosa]
MRKGAKSKNQAPATPNEVQGTGARPLLEGEANFGTLKNSITDMLGAVKSMSLQLDETSSTVKGLVVINSKNADMSIGKSTKAEPVMSVNSKRDVVGEFHKLKQTTTVANYQGKFEALRDLMVKMNYGLSEGYLIANFLSGLKSEIKLSIANHKPETLYHAFNLAHAQETALKEMKDEGMEDKLIKTN